MTFAEAYSACLDAANAQQQRASTRPPQEDPWGGSLAQVFRLNPRRQLDPNLETVAAYLKPEDVLIDVGGGAGRVSLPLALRCRQAINVDSSPGMGAVFEGLAAEAGINNARWVRSGWLDAEGVRGDVVITSDVTYFVRDIVPFVRKLEASAARRVMITVWSVPPPSRSGKLFQFIHGEAQQSLPGHRELLPVLWEMDLLPEIRVLPRLPWWETEALPTREEAVALALESRWVNPEDQSRVHALIETHFQELFIQEPNGFRPLWRADVREMLITWETGRG